WAHQGPPKPAQKNKVLADALKLLYVERLKSVPARKILLFGDRVAARRFQGENWMARAMESFGIEIKIIELPLEMRNAVEKAQKRQYRELGRLHGRIRDSDFRGQAGEGKRACAVFQFSRGGRAARHFGQDFW